MKETLLPAAGLRFGRCFPAALGPEVSYQRGSELWFRISDEGGETLLQGRWHDHFVPLSANKVSRKVNVSQGICGRRPRCAGNRTSAEFVELL